MPSFTEISTDKLNRLIGTPGAPVLIDVRNDEDFSADPRLIPGSIRRPFKDVDEWGAEIHGPAVIVCHHGAKLSHGVAAHLRAGRAGRNARRRVRGMDQAQAASPCPRRSCRLATPRGGRFGSPRPPEDRPYSVPLVDPPLRGSVRGLSVRSRRGRAYGRRPLRGNTFDIEDVFWSHRGDRCSFDIMVEEFALQSGPLLRLATIVRAADTARLDLAPEAAGLLAASLGLSRMFADDLEQLDAGMTLYDAFYRWCRTRPRKPTIGPPRRREAEMANLSQIRPPRERRASMSHGISFGEAFRVWLRVAALSFGGPAGQIAVMHRIVVDEKKWIGEQRFLQRSTIACCCPGPRRNNSPSISAG